MYRVTFELGTFQRGSDANKVGAALEALLDALFRVNKAYLRHNPHTPRLYKSGVRYEAEPYGQENWQDIPRTLELRKGDCEDLASWLAAERVVLDGIDAWPAFRWRRLANGLRLYHIIVAYPDGTIEDPSRKLGMRTSRPVGPNER